MTMRTGENRMDGKDKKNRRHAHDENGDEVRLVFGPVPDELKMSGESLDALVANMREGFRRNTEMRNASLREAGRTSTM